MVTVHGTLAQMPQGGSCTVHGGDHVTITDLSGNVLVTPRLADTPVAKKYPVGRGSVVTEQAYQFKAAVPAEPDYRIIAKADQDYFMSEAQLEQGADLNC
jgi:hypothetical protein